MHSLTLHTRLAESTTGIVFTHPITELAHGWRRTTRDIGGYWLGSFNMSEEDLTLAELTDFYNRNIGCRLVERTAGIVTWEGYLVEMRLRAGGSEFFRSLSPEWFHNKVKALYVTTAGANADTGWSEDTDSSDYYGEMNMILTLPAAVAGAATATVTRHLLDFAFPRSREMGGPTFGKVNRKIAPASLSVSVAGFWHSMNWRYRASDTLAVSSTLVEDLVDDSEFVTAKRIETNAQNVASYHAQNPQRLGDAIENIVLQGDASGNFWKGGVYADRGFIFEQAPTDWTYQKQGAYLLQRGGAAPMFPMVEPGFLLFNAEAPSGGTPIGGSAWDDPRISYVDEVEYQGADRGGEPQLKLKLSGRETSNVYEAVVQAKSEFFR